MNKKQFIRDNIQTLRKIYISGVENISSVYKNFVSERRKRNVKLFFYYIAICVLNKRHFVEKEITVISGNSQRRNADSQKLKFHVYRSNWFNSIKELREGVTVVSPFSRLQRIKILLDSIWFKNVIGSRDLGMALDFYFLTCFFIEACVSKVNGRGHYDECATWLGGLSRLIGYKYSVYQHGVVTNKVHVPNKYFCDNVFGFDSYSLKVFKENVIENDDCKFVVYPFAPSVSFASVDKKQGKIYVGIIEQTDRKWVEQILATLSDEPDLMIYIMKHPLTKEDYESNSNILVTNKKIDNLDIIVTANSTLLLDYVRAKYQGKMIITDQETAEIFSDYKEIKLVDSIDDLKKFVSEIREELTNESHNLCK